MAKSSVQIENSFTFRFRNTTNSIKKVTLFKEGLDNSNGSSLVQNYNSANVTQLTYNTLCDTALWSVASQQPFTYSGGVVITEPFLINNWVAQYNCILVINTTGSTVINVNITTGDTLEVVNKAINDSIRANATTNDLKSPSGQYAQVFITFDSNYFLSQNITYPYSVISPFATNSWGISIQYPTDLANRVTNLNFDYQGSAEFNNINLITTQKVQSANGVIIEQASNVSYDEILESQNGGALQIESLVVNIGKTPTISEKTSQLLQPYKFAKRDVNGNEIDVVKNQTIDPYQYQYSYSKVDLVEEENGDEYILDGNTGFIYNVEPNTKVFLTYNYRKVSNSTYQKISGVESLKKDDKNIDVLSNETEYAYIKVIDNLPQQNITPKPRKRNWEKFFFLIMGSYALYLLTKTNKP